MVKKGIQKKKVSSSISIKNSSTEKILVENFVALQKVMVNLSSKFDNLTKQISELLNLFEISAKSLAEKDFDMEQNKKDNKEIVTKLNTLLDQNKILAQGLSLLHEPEPEHMSIPQRPMPKPMPVKSSGLPMPPKPEGLNKPQIKPLPSGQNSMGDYQKSISSSEPISGRE